MILGLPLAEAQAKHFIEFALVSLVIPKMAKNCRLLANQDDLQSAINIACNALVIPTDEQQVVTVPH